jgi:hypothetical protein
MGADDRAQVWSHLPRRETYNIFSETQLVAESRWERSFGSYPGSSVRTTTAHQAINADEVGSAGDSS